MRTPLIAKIFAAAAVLSLGAAPGFAQSKCGPPDEDAPPIHDSLRVTSAWLAQHLNDTDLVIVQVDHMSDAYGRGHIPGARHADAMGSGGWSVGNFDLPPANVLDSLVKSLGIGEHTRVVLYGDPWVTGFVFVALDLLGHGDRVAILDGGLSAWRAEGYPVTTELPRVARATSAPRTRTEPVVDGPWVRAHLTDQRTVILDVRSPGEYRGDPGMSHGRDGHIPGAHFLDWSRIFVHPTEAIRGGDAHLLPPADLRALVREVGVHAGLTPVTYCMIGMRASQMYYILRYLGYAPKFYDGSIADWGPRTDYPVVTGTARGTP